MMRNHIAILSSLLVGLAATLGTIVIHGFAVHTIVMTLRRNLQRGVIGVRLRVNMTCVTSATLIVLAWHLMEIALWAFALDICGAVADISAAIILGWQLHDCGFRHRIAAAMEAAGTTGSGVRKLRTRAKRFPPRHGLRHGPFGRRLTVAKIEAAEAWLEGREVRAVENDDKWPTSMRNLASFDDPTDTAARRADLVSALRASLPNTALADKVIEAIASGTGAACRRRRR
jgi:hypothetical protein